jgi:hypothetical protein
VEKARHQEGFTQLDLIDLDSANDSISPPAEGQFPKRRLLVIQFLEVPAHRFALLCLTKRGNQQSLVRAHFDNHGRNAFQIDRGIGETRVRQLGKMGQLIGHLLQLARNLFARFHPQLDACPTCRSSTERTVSFACKSTFAWAKALGTERTIRIRKMNQRCFMPGSNSICTGTGERNLRFCFRPGWPSRIVGVMPRCPWATSEPSITYHDEEWGVPVHDDRKLSSSSSSRRAGRAELDHYSQKRENYRKALDGFRAEKIARLQRARYTPLAE